MGTPQYMSPEQCLGEQLDGRSDIYSLGIVLYEMLCGTVPFKGPSASAVAVFQVQKQPPPLRSLNPEIHPEVETVILRSLSKSPDDRPRTAPMLSQELIKAVTFAFKSGFTAVSAEPIAAPDVAPEFDAEGSTVPSGPTAVPPPPAEEIIPRAPNEPGNSIESISEQYSTTPQIGGSSRSADQETVAIPAVKIDPVPIASPPDDLREFDPNDVELPEEFSGNDKIVEDEGTQEAGETEVPTSETVDPPAVEDEPDQPAAGRRGHTALIVGVLVFVGLIFVSSLVAGVWYFTARDTSVLSESPAPDLAAAKPDATNPPAGMAYVPGGEFMMGSDNGDEYSRPAHKTSVKPFFIDLTEVTNEEYKKFVDASGRKPPPDWKDGTFPEGRAKFPVTGVDWNDADAYARWAGKRLPTEAEWEFAARGNDGRIYPWGNDWTASLANAGGGSKGLREVGQGGKSPFGLFDMSGTAWEWTASDAAAYPGGKEFATAKAGARVIRGGYWGSDAKVASGIGRRAYGISGEVNGYPNSSFRCAQDPK
jgi:formylglycine-generating enzyme required for sulfatase activity